MPSYYIPYRARLLSHTPPLAGLRVPLLVPLLLPKRLAFIAVPEVHGRPIGEVVLAGARHPR